MNVLVIICILVIILIIVHHLSSYVEALDARPRVDIVIARYAESLDWLCDNDIIRKISRNDVETNLLIYNKGEDNVIIPECLPKNIEVQVLPLPNVGRCDHTFLYHILKNYDNLADVTIFLPGSSSMSAKFDRAKFVLIRAFNDINTVMICQKYDNVKTSLYDFQLDSWMSSNKENADINKSADMEVSSIRPFGVWFEDMFGVDLLTSCVTWYGIFAVSRKHIQNRDMDFYNKLISFVDKHNNPEAGHYIERSWFAIFHPLSEDVIFLDSALPEI